MGPSNSIPYEKIIARGSLGEADLAKLRDSFGAASQADPADVERLFAIHSQCPVKCSDWADWFIATASDYIVHGAEPKGYVTQENADWLIRQIARDGRIGTRAELDLLIDVLESARWAPRSLVAFGLMQVRHAVAEGDGPLRPGQPRVLGQLFDEEIEIVRRMIYAFGGDDCVALTREEAEILFDINDALDGRRVNTGWTELFVKAIANVMLAASGYRVPTREEALRSEAWFDRSGEAKPEDIVKAIVKSGLDGVFDAYRTQNRVEQALSQLEREYRSMITGEEPEPQDAGWLAARFGRQHELTLNERALIDYLAEVQVVVEPTLQKALERVRSAA